MTEKLTNQQREYEAQQMHRQHLQVRPLSTPSKFSLLSLCGKIVNVNTSYLIFFFSVIFQAFVDRWRYNAKRASLAQSRLKALEKL